MQIAVKPTTLTLPGKGTFVVNLIDVRVVGYQLGEGTSSFYELLNKSTDGVVISSGLSGNYSIPADAFARWGTDDNIFIDSVLTHLNLQRV